MSSKRRDSELRREIDTLKLLHQDLEQQIREEKQLEKKADLANQSLKMLTQIFSLEFELKLNRLRNRSPAKPKSPEKPKPKSPAKSKSPEKPKSPAKSKSPNRSSSKPPAKPKSPNRSSPKRSPLRLSPDRSLQEMLEKLKIQKLDVRKRLSLLESLLSPDRSLQEMLDKLSHKLEIALKELDVKKRLSLLESLLEEVKKNELDAMEKKDFKKKIKLLTLQDNIETQIGLCKLNTIYGKNRFSK